MENTQIEGFHYLCICLFVDLFVCCSFFVHLYIYSLKYVILLKKIGSFIQGKTQF